MKGLKQYTKKYGKHFTEALVEDVLSIKWSYTQIEDSIRGEVWYNCWSASKGDMLFLVNTAYNLTRMNKRWCILFMLGIVEDYENKDKWFNAWLEETAIKDLTDYI